MFFLILIKIHTFFLLSAIYSVWSVNQQTKMFLQYIAKSIFKAIESTERWAVIIKYDPKVVYQNTREHQNNTIWLSLRI